MQLRNREALSDILSFIASALSNFAIGWELVGVFPSDVVENLPFSDHLIIIGVLIMVVAIVVRYLACLLR